MKMGRISDSVDRLTRVFCLALMLGGFMPSETVRAEGSVQFGLGQDMNDAERAVGSGQASDSDSSSLFVDIVTTGEVINISACGSTNGDTLTVEIFDPSDTSVLGGAATLDGGAPNGGLIDCADPMSAPLTNPFRYVTATTGTYRIVMQNTSFGSASDDSRFERYDITVTPDARD